MLNGIPVIYGIDPQSTEAVSQHQIGSLGVDATGRLYRYTQNASTELAVGILTVAADIETQHEDLAVNTAAAGDTSLDVTLGSTAITGNEYQNGYVMVIDAAGQGAVYTIKSAPAAALSTVVTIQLVEPIVIAFEAATTVTLVRNKFRDVVISDGTQADLPVGVTPVLVPADEFFWAQTGGYSCILVDTNDTVAGQPITIGASVNGAVETHNAATEVVVGMQPTGANSDAAESGVYILTLD